MIIKEHPEWSWSVTRDSIFDECMRKYYYHYYCAHNGWLLESTSLSKSAYRLKHMSNLFLLFGEFMHKAVKHVLLELKGSRIVIPKEECIDYIRDQLNQAYLSSKSADLESWSKNPKGVRMLHEIYYGKSLPEKRVKLIRERIQACVDNFYASESFLELIQNPEFKFVELERLNSMEIDGNKIFVMLDLLYRTDNKWVIVDWKTGSDYETNLSQMQLYALYVHEQYKVPYDQIEIRLHYLLTGKCINIDVDQVKLEKVKKDVLESIRKMKDLLEDCQTNRPFPASHYKAVSQPRVCEMCNYREICDESAFQ